MQVTLDKYSAMTEIKKGFSESFDSIKDELDQHLDSINQNSVEIQSNYDFVDELNARMSKMEERLDDLTSMFMDNSPSKIEVQKPTFALTDREKEIFFVFYTTQEPLSYQEVSMRSSIPEFEVEDLVTSLKIKNIPLIKKTFAGKTLMILDNNFRDEQSKYNLINLNQNLITNF